MDAGAEDSFPPYAFIPGGPWPHPRENPEDGGKGRAAIPPIAGDDWRKSAAYLRGVSLFNAGYYWEAHEAWEGLWHAHGRRGATAELLKGLIKLAAAGVKVRERRPLGVVSHARRAAGSFESARQIGGRRQLGLDLDDWIEIARQVAEAPPVDPAPPGERVVRVFSFRLEPR